MDFVTVSPKFQVVIPKEQREGLHIKAGNKLAIIEKDGILSLVPILPLKELRGKWRGGSTEGIREEEDRI